MTTAQPSNCWARQCIHLTGHGELFGGKMKPTCEAFPKGIPREIAFGDNKHLKPFPGQENDIVYERKKR